MTASRCGTMEGLRYINAWCPTPHAEGPFAELVYRIPWSVKTLRDGSGFLPHDSEGIPYGPVSDT